MVSRRHAQRTPYEAVYADISISPAAFVEPYGVSGLSVAGSVIAGASIGPVTAFVEANASALTPALRPPSSRPWVAGTFVRYVSSGCSIERSTEVTAAR